MGNIHSPEDSLVITCRVKGNRDLKDIARMIAIEETTGKWQGGEEITDLYKKCRGEVYKIEKLPGENTGIVTLLYPLINMNIEETPFTSIWLFMTSSLFEFADFLEMRLLDFHIPDRVIKKFPGPQFGIRRTRKLLGLKEDEPIIGTIVKPCSGLTPEEVAQRCYEAALGGVRFIKDDEKMGNPDYCPLDKRVRLVSQALRRAEEETGQKVLYLPHITTRMDKIMEKVKIAIENGADGVMFNFFAAGMIALQMIAEDPHLDIPIYAHCGGRSALSRAPNYGIDNAVICRMVRLLGGDYFRTGVIGGAHFDGPDTIRRMTRVFREEMGGIREMVPVISGNLHPGNLGANIKFSGMDCLFLAGTGILSHPLGIKAGVTAFQQAAQAYKEGVPLEDYARGHRELKMAIEKFGVVKYAPR